MVLHIDFYLEKYTYTTVLNLLLKKTIQLEWVCSEVWVMEKETQMTLPDLSNTCNYCWCNAWSIRTQEEYEVLPQTTSRWAVRAWCGTYLSSPTMFVPIRCALMCITCDLPATCKVCGFSFLHGCSKCFKKFTCESFGQKSDYSGYDRDTWPVRNHLQQV